LIYHAPARERFAFVHRLRGQFGVRRPCRILVTDHSNYYAWGRAKGRRDERTVDDQELAAWIVEIHETHTAYRAERVTRELKRQGVEVGRRRVARLMREHCIAGISRRKRRNLTKPAEYTLHYNAVRPHRALRQLSPSQAETAPPEPIDLAAYRLRRKPVLGGLTSEY
jgi:hypothetical protein